MCKDLDDEIVYEDEYLSSREVRKEKVFEEESIRDAPLSVHDDVTASLLQL